MVAKDVLYISDCSIVMRCVDTISISPELRQQGSLMLEKPNTVSKNQGFPSQDKVVFEGKNRESKSIKLTTYNATFLAHLSLQAHKVSL